MLDAVSMGFLMMLALWEKDVAAHQSLSANSSIPILSRLSSLLRERDSDSGPCSWP